MTGEKDGHSPSPAEVYNPGDIAEYGEGHGAEELLHVNDEESTLPRFGPGFSLVVGGDLEEEIHHCTSRSSQVLFSKHLPVLLLIVTKI
jgi:hypothetical protein